MEDMSKYTNYTILILIYVYLYRILDKLYMLHMHYTDFRIYQFNHGSGSDMKTLLETQTL